MRNKASCKRILSKVENNIWLSRSISVDPSSTLKNNSHSGKRLIDKPDIFLESLDNSEQNQHRCIFIFFQFFWL